MKVTHYPVCDDITHLNMIRILFTWSIVVNYIKFMFKYHLMIGNKKGPFL